MAGVTINSAIAGREPSRRWPSPRRGRDCIVQRTVALSIAHSLGMGRGELWVRLRSRASH